MLRCCFPFSVRKKSVLWLDLNSLIFISPVSTLLLIPSSEIVQVYTVYVYVVCFIPQVTFGSFFKDSVLVLCSLCSCFPLNTCTLFACSIKSFLLTDFFPNHVSIFSCCLACLVILIECWTLWYYIFECLDVVGRLNHLWINLISLRPLFKLC